MGRRKKQRNKRVVGRSGTEETPSAHGFAVIGLVTLAVAIFLLFIRASTIRDALSAADWQAVPCVIEENRFATGDEGERQLRLTYRYEYHGRQFRSNELDLVPDSISDGGEWQQEIHAKYPVGTKAVCYVNPQDPGQATFDRTHAIVMAQIYGLVVSVLVHWRRFFSSRCQTMVSRTSKRVASLRSRADSTTTSTTRTDTIDSCPVVRSLRISCSLDIYRGIQLCLCHLRRLRRVGGFFRD